MISTLVVSAADLDFDLGRFGVDLGFDLGRDGLEKNLRGFAPQIFFSLNFFCPSLAEFSIAAPGRSRKRPKNVRKRLKTSENDQNM